MIRVLRNIVRYYFAYFYFKPTKISKVMTYPVGWQVNLG